MLSHMEKNQKDTVVKSVTHRIKVSPEEEGRKSKGHMSWRGKLDVGQPIPIPHPSKKGRYLLALPSAVGDDEGGEVRTGYICSG